MISPVIIRDTVLGRGRPKICVPILSADTEALQKQLLLLRGAPYDLVEWRLDYLADDSVPAVMHAMIRQEIRSKPLLATFRSAREGGMREIDPDEYVHAYDGILALGTDLIDVEMQQPEGIRDLLIQKAHDHGAYVVMSYHNFESTPPHDEIIRLFTAMQESGADICKIAVMPQTKEDVAALIGASHTMAWNYADRPLISVSMGELGKSSRVACRFTGSCLTFATAGPSSAPGQFSAEEVSVFLDLSKPAGE